MSKGLTFRLLGKDGEIWDIQNADGLFGVGRMNTRLVSFEGKIFMDVGEDFRDGLWVKLFRETHVLALRPSGEPKRTNDLEKALKLVDGLVAERDTVCAERDAAREAATSEREACAKECVRNIPQKRIDAWRQSPRNVTVDQDSALALSDRILARGDRSSV